MRISDSKRHCGSGLHQLDALLRDAVLMGQRPAAGGKNKLCFVVLCKAVQGVLCHVVGVAVGAEDKVRPQLPRRKGGRNVQMNRLFSSNIWFMGPEPWPRSSMADKQPEM